MSPSTSQQSNKSASSSQGQRGIQSYFKPAPAQSASQTQAIERGVVVEERAAKRLKSEPQTRLHSSPGSHLTSPAPSDHSSAPALTSPPDVDGDATMEDDAFLTTGVSQKLSRFSVKSAAPSSAGGSTRGPSPVALAESAMRVDEADDTQAVVAPGVGAKGKGKVLDDEEEDEDGETPGGAESSPPVQLSRIRRGRPAPTVHESPDPSAVIDLRSPDRTAVARTLDYHPSANSPLGRQPSAFRSSPSATSTIPSNTNTPPPSTTATTASHPSVPAATPVPYKVPSTAPSLGSAEFLAFFTQAGKGAGSFSVQQIRTAWTESGGNAVAAMGTLVQGQARASGSGSVRAGQMGPAGATAGANGSSSPGGGSGFPAGFGARQAINSSEKHKWAQRLVAEPEGYYTHLLATHKLGKLHESHLATLKTLHQKYGNGVALPSARRAGGAFAAAHSQTGAAGFYGGANGGSRFGAAPGVGGSLFARPGAPAAGRPVARPSPTPAPMPTPPRPKTGRIKDYSNPELQAASPPRPTRPVPEVVSTRPAPKVREVREPTPPPVKKLKQRKPVGSDSEDEGAWSDGSGESYGGGEAAADLARKNEEALAFFNTADKAALTELVGCTLDQANLLINLRPFTTPDEFRTKTRKQKGVGNNLFDAYLELQDGMKEVDKILSNCEAIGKDLNRVMRIWAGELNPTEAAAAVGSVGAADGDVGLDLVAVKEEDVTKAVETSVDPAVKEAFKGYLTRQPELVSDKIQLKDYQLLGVNWLNLLYRRRLSCILADEMGLGKTAQVISLIAHLKNSGEKGPHLVIVPSSTLENWMREFSVFAPSLVARSYYGSMADRAEIRHELREQENLDVVVTTYNIVGSTPDDIKFFKRKMTWNVAVFDEGHQLKNSASKKHKDLMVIPVKWRLLLTGTPLQNNLQELVSLLSFILPEQFRDAGDAMRAIFKVAPGASGNLLSRERTSRAKKMMTPFVLRRKKAQVLKDLPSKHVRIHECGMTDLQKEVYLEAMMRGKRTLLTLADDELDAAAAEADGTEDGEKPKKKGGKAKAVATKSGKAADASSSSHVLMDLRKAANHPMLFRRLYDDSKLKLMARECLKELDFAESDPALIVEDMEVMTDFELHRFCGQYRYLKKFCLVNDEWMSAGKIEELQEMLPRLKENGDRVLLFSQFTMVLDILQVVLDTMGIRYLKLTGQTNVTDRQGLVDEYNDDPDITVFRKLNIQ